MTPVRPTRLCTKSIRAITTPLRSDAISHPDLPRRALSPPNARYTPVHAICKHWSFLLSRALMPPHFVPRSSDIFTAGRHIMPASNSLNLNYAGGWCPMRAYKINMPDGRSFQSAARHAPMTLGRQPETCATKTANLARALPAVDRFPALDACCNQRGSREAAPVQHAASFRRYSSFVGCRFIGSNFVGNSCISFSYSETATAAAVTWRREWVLEWRRGKLSIAGC